MATYVFEVAAAEGLEPVMFGLPGEPVLGHGAGYVEVGGALDRQGGVQDVADG